MNEFVGFGYSGEDLRESGWHGGFGCICVRSVDPLSPLNVRSLGGVIFFRIGGYMRRHFFIPSFHRVPLIMGIVEIV